MSGQVVSVNVGLPREVTWFGRRVTSGIWKEPVSGPVALAGVNVAGDGQADLRVHGGSDKAVYAYAVEDYDWWSEQLDGQLAPGLFGENLTLRGVDLRACSVGETWAIGEAILRVTQPRFPCFKLGMRMGDSSFVERFSTARRFGTYFAIEGPGLVAAGDAVRRTAQPDVILRIGEFIDGSEDNDVTILRRIADHPLVPAVWREHAARAVERATR